MCVLRVITEAEDRLGSQVFVSEEYMCLVFVWTCVFLFLRAFESTLLQRLAA